MVWVDDFEEFVTRAIQLYQEHPDRTRYSTKYRHVDSRLELKVTDDRTCLKYRTDQESDVRKVERLNLVFLRLMSKEEA